MTDADPGELAAIAQRIDAFRERLDAACRAAGRQPSEVTLIAVTKNHPPEYAAAAARAGLHELGENKPQELAVKREGLGAIDPSLAAAVRWHFIGRLQRNKAKQVVANADMVHSVDRPALADALGKAADASDRWSPQNPLPVLLQVNLDPEAPREGHDSTAARGGVHPLDLSALAHHAASYADLRVRGVMAVAPLGADPAECFARLQQASELLREEQPEADLISAGMTGDFPQAIACGATHVRVGTALFGSRALT